jgi:ketosteroid isomerase-like protein
MIIKIMHYKTWFNFDSDKMEANIRRNSSKPLFERMVVVGNKTGRFFTLLTFLFRGMKMLKSITCLFVIITTSPCLAYCQQAKQEIEAINKSIAHFYSGGMVDSIVAHYGKTFMYMPEYKPIITNTADLKAFYAGWFKSVAITDYSKHIYEILPIDSFLLETGNFSLQYVKAGNPANYSGKYMIIWKRGQAGKLQIVSEIFGSNTYIASENVPYTQVVVKENKLLYKNKVGKKILPAVLAYSGKVATAVINGDGNERANGFTEDGIYMPHFDQMQIGMAAIRPYMLKTYSPGVFTYNINTFYEIFDTGGFVFLNGAFKVGNRKGGFTGNMSNLLKKESNGKLLMYRQLAHNDR